MKILSCLIVIGILMSPVPFLVASASDNNIIDKITNTCLACSKRPTPTGEVAKEAMEASLAPGYCPSYGGSHEYEYISSVTYTINPGGTITITVDIYIANPTGCTYGEPCPEYDNSPEYINAWIDWDGDKSWEPSERVMDEALTGYVNINYHGTMTTSKIVTIPDDAVGSTWMRVNLGWGHDPNDPCEEAWTWGDVVDKEVIIKPEIKDFKVVGGLSRYEGKYKDIVFRRGDDNPRFEVTASVPSDNKVKIDIFKNGNTLTTLDAVWDANKGIYVAVWDWKSKTWSKIPDEIPVSEYKAKAKIVAKDGAELVSSDEKEFYVIFDTPKALGDAEKRAYLYSDSKEDRYIKGNYYGERNWGATKFFERKYYLEPVDEHIFNISIHVVDSIVEKTAAAEKLCTMVYNIIHYSKPHKPQNVPHMLKKVSVEDAIKASNGQKINKIEGQCLDYGNTLTSVLRSVGIAARPATGIWYLPSYNWAYHVWTEVYVPEAPGDDPWYVYDGTLNSQSKRISFSWGRNASEVAVGNKVWKADGGILKRTDRKITRYNNQAKDILFEKCENKKYNDFGCSISSSIKSLSELSNCSINLTLDKYITRVGVPRIANITLANYEDKDVTFELNFSIYAFDPSSPIMGYDRLIDYQTMDVTIPPNSNITLQQTFFINTTNYPYETYIVEVIGKNGNTSCNATASLEVLPAYDINITLPDGIGIKDQVPITITICNNVSFVIENITMQIDIPAEYFTFDEVIKNISSLIPGACEVDYLTIIPTEEDFFPILSLYFTVDSDNGGNYSAGLYKELVEGQKLDVEDVYIPFDVEFGKPFGIGFKIKNIGDLTATNVLAEITLPENVTATETTWNIGDLAGGENVSLYTNITFTKPEDFVIDIFASDDDGHNASGVIYVDVLSNLSASFNDMYSDYGLDTNGDGMYDYLMIEVGVNVTSAGIGNVEGWLCDSNGTEIVKAENSSYLSTGNYSLILKFDGFDIYKHGVNGPYDLRDLNLYNESGALIDSRDYAYSTSAYNYTDFQHLVALTGYYADYGTDTDGNGLFDNLTVEVGVILASEGHCVATARLVDKNGEEIVWASNTTWLEANKSQIIQLNFDGRSIGKHGVDGPYYLKDVYVYHTGDPTQSDYVCDAYTTNFYNYTDFEGASLLSINLYTGWNMISLPLRPDNLSASSVLGTIPNAGGIAYLWNASKGAYDAIYGDMELEPGRAYWVSVTGDGTWTPTGSEIHGTKVNLTPGWNMIGVPSAANVSVADITVTVGADTYTLVEAAQNGYIGGIFYSWNTANEEWDATIISDTATLKPGTGYFINVNQECQCAITYP